MTTLLILLAVLLAAAGFVLFLFSRGYGIEDVAPPTPAPMPKAEAPTVTVQFTPAPKPEPIVIPLPPTTTAPPAAIVIEPKPEPKPEPMAFVPKPKPEPKPAPPAPPPPPTIVERVVEVIKEVFVPVPTPPAAPGDLVRVRFVTEKGRKLGNALLAPKQRRPCIRHRGKDGAIGVFLASHTDEDGTWVYRRAGVERE